MNRTKHWASWLALRTTQPDIVFAQMHELKRQVPLLYSLLSINVAAVAYSHAGQAPDWLAVWTPVLLVAICMLRLFVWTRRRIERPTFAECRRKLRFTIVLATIIAGAFVAWALALDAYGGPYERAHVSLFIAVTLIACIFCLKHLPQAVFAVATMVTLPYLVHYFRTDNTVFALMALNILLVSAVMIKVLWNAFQSFTQLIHSRRETERLGAENLRLAHTDALTGLPNRRFFFAELTRRIEAAAADGSVFAIGLIDLDRFKAVNDTYGHAMGDRLLEGVGQRLAEEGTGNHLLFRLGGDEFGFLMEADGPGAEAAARRLCELVSDTYRIDDLSLTIGCSAGIALYPEAGTTPNELFDRSDYALYNSKQAGRSMVTLYSAEHERRIRSERVMEAALQGADLDAELELHLQPIVTVEGRSVTAVEALARWTSPSLGRVPPDVFVPLAERTGLVRSMTLALFRKALAALERLPGDVGLSFNLSAHDVTCRQTVLTIVTLVRQAEINPGRLTFELTETAVMRDFDIASQSMSLLRALGAKIALDDFGTGYSSLSYLHRLTIDRIKIDRSFVQAALEPTGRSLLASMMALVHTMGLECVAEGVEKESQLAVLRVLGCHAFQGYLYARPMAVDDIVALIDASRTARRSDDRS